VNQKTKYIGMGSTFSVNSNEAVGLVITIVAFAIILSPIAMSDADPYQIKNSLEEIKSLFTIQPDIKKSDEIPLPNGKFIKVSVILKTKPSQNLPEDAYFSPYPNDLFENS